MTDALGAARDRLATLHEELIRAIRGFLDGSEIAADDGETDWHLDPQERQMLSDGLAACLIDLGFIVGKERVTLAAPAPAGSTDILRAYTPGTWPRLPIGRANGEPVALVLNAYHLRNLRWLLRHAFHSTMPSYTNTGDWCGEILWALEQAMLDTGLTGRDAWANGPDGGWPIQGWGKSSSLNAVLAARGAPAEGAT